MGIQHSKDQIGNVYLNYWKSYIDDNIKHCRKTHCKFASSSVVNKEAKVQSERLYCELVQHYRDLGYTVHSPPTFDILNVALELASKNEELQSLRYIVKKDGGLKNIILIEIKE